MWWNWSICNERRYPTHDNYLQLIVIHVPVVRSYHFTIASLHDISLDDWSLRSNSWLNCIVCWYLNILYSPAVTTHVNSFPHTEVLLKAVIDLRKLSFTFSFLLLFYWHFSNICIFVSRDNSRNCLLNCFFEYLTIPQQWQL